MAAILLEARGLCKAYGTRDVLRDVSLSVSEGEKIGLIGANGAGKSTLLSILSGALRPDSGQVRRYGSTACIAQSGDGEDAADAEIRARLGAQEIREGLSGGEKTRRRIAAALSARPALLLADEPTADLDEAGLRFLREALLRHRGALVLISHDRAVLEAVCGRIWYLEDGTLRDFPGGYAAFREEQERERERARFEYGQYRAEQARLQAAARAMEARASSVRKAPKRMGNSEARLHRREASDAVLSLSHAKRTMQNRMERLEEKPRPKDLPEVRMESAGLSRIGAKTALTLRCERLSAGGRVLLRGAELALPTGSRTALTGPNGSGKTTLLSVLTGQSGPGVSFSGTVRWNPAAETGWFDQHHERTLSPGKTLLENVCPDGRRETDARTVLARLGFARADAGRALSLFSAGERAKAALARLLLSRCNVLLLDEPGNALDLFAREALEELLSAWPGTLLFVSHDEAFVRRVATRAVRIASGTLRTEEEPGRGGAPSAGRDARRETDISVLSMRLAALSARIAHPGKGDRPDALEAEYRETAAALRALRDGADGGA